MANYCSCRSGYRECFCKIISVSASADYLLVENLDNKKYERYYFTKVTPRTRKEVIEHFRKRKINEIV